MNKKNQRRTIIILIVFAIVCAMSLFFGIRKANAQSEGIYWCNKRAVYVYDGTGHYQWKVGWAAYAWNLQGARLRIYRTTNPATADIRVYEHYLYDGNLAETHIAYWPANTFGNYHACFAGPINIWVDPRYRGIRNAGRVSQHEIGHALGEAHNYTYQWSVMYSGNRTEYWSGYPNWYDAWQLREMYGAEQ